jgi:hypothetical protein
MLVAAFFMARALSVLIESEPGSGLLFGRVFFTRTGIHGACHRARIRATRWLENALIAGSTVKRPRPAGLHWSGAEDDEVLVDENAPPRSRYEARHPRVSRQRD